MRIFPGRTTAAIIAITAISMGAATGLTIKFATIAPQATPWGAAMERMVSDLNGISGGELDVKVFHGGIAGDESDILRKLKIGQLQGAALTNLGLNLISPEALTLSAPFLIQDDDELDYIIAKNRAYMQGKIEAKGFIVLAWSKAGWIRFFSKAPLSAPADLKGMKLSTTPTDLSLAQAFKTLGYNLVPVPLNETLVALSSGMIDASYISPLAAGAMQFFGSAKYMTDFRVSPFIGAIIVSKQSWAKVNPTTKARIHEYATAIEKNLNEEIVKLEDSAVTTMVKYGLVITKNTPEQVDAWKKDIQQGIPATLGTSFDRDFYLLLSSQLEEYRAKKKK